MNRKKILLVDDNPIIVKTLSMKLESKGFEVIPANDGAEAASAIRRSTPDLILLDLSFPPDPANVGGIAWDGFLIIEWIRRLETAKNIPFVVITGSDPKEYKDKAIAAGAVAFFHKPIDNDGLLDFITKTLGESGASSKP